MNRDFLGNKVPKKEIQRAVIDENRRKGRMGEENVKMKFQMRGYDVERSPRGKDFIARKRDIFTGRVTETKHIEVKTGKAKLSRLQEKTRKNTSNYQVVRDDPLFW